MLAHSPVKECAAGKETPLERCPSKNNIKTICKIFGN